MQIRRHTNKRHHFIVILTLVAMQQWEQRQTDRQTETETWRQRERQRQRQGERHRERERDTERETGSERERGCVRAPPVVLNGDRNSQNLK